MPQVSLLLFLAGALALLIVWIARQYRSHLGARPFIWMQLSVALWCFGYGFERLTTDPGLAAGWAVIEYLAITSLPVFWFLFALEYTQQGKYIWKVWRYALWVMPALVILAVVTNSFHHLFWSSVTLVDVPFPVIVFEHGPLFWIHSIYAYFLMALGALVFLLSGFRYPKYYRRQVAIILFAAAIPCFANLLYMLKVVPLPGIDPTPLSFVLTGILIYYGISRAGLLNLTPIAQDLLFENVLDGILLLDAQSRLVNLNPSARTLLGLAEYQPVGKPIAQIIPEWAGIAPGLEGVQHFHTVCYFSNTHRHIDITATSLNNVDNRSFGWVLVLRDITAHLQMEEALKSQADQLTHVIDYVPAVLVYTSMEGRLIFFNRALSELLNQPAEKLMGALVRDIVPERVFQRLAVFYQRALSGERIAIDTLIEDNAGTPLYFHIDLIPHCDEKGSVRAVLALAQDITERHTIEQNEKQQRAWAEALRQTVAALNSTLEYDEVLDIILDRISIVLPHDAANIALMDSPDNVRIQRAHGYSKYVRQETDPFPPFTLSRFSNWRKMTITAHPMAIPDTHKDPDWLITPELSWVRSYAGAPICIANRVIGFLSLDSATPGFFSQGHAEHLMSFANEAAVAIEKARLYVDVRRRAEELTSINRIANAITSGLDLDRVMDAILVQCQQVLPLDVFYIALYNDEIGFIELPLFFDLGQVRSMPARRIAENPGLTGLIIQKRQTIYIPDVIDPDYMPPVEIVHLGGVSSRCYLGAPLILRDRVIGVISIQTYYPDAYTQDQIRLLEIIATQAAIALENARLYTQAQYMAITDSLTGLYNRRYILEQAVRLIEESNQTGAPLSIILLDGDWFKRINDTYGHLAGDRALQVLAETCSQNLRPQDDVGRFGGEEYCILLPGLELEEGGRAAEKIRSALPEQILTFDDKTFTVSASFGVAQYIPGESLEQTISRADDALYRAKTSGRNRIELASP